MLFIREYKVPPQVYQKIINRWSYGHFILEHAACGQIDATDHTLLASYTRYPFVDAEETLGFLHFLLKQTTALIKIFQIQLSFIQLLFYDIKMLNLE